MLELLYQIWTAAYVVCVHILRLLYYCVHRCVRACAVCVAESID